MTGVWGLRIGLGGLGVLVGLYGAYLLLSRQDLDRLVSAAIWLGGGVVVHDGLIALATIGAVALGARVLPVVARAPAAVAFVVVAPLTLIAIPVLGRFGAEPDNPTLLDRSYWLGWSGLVVVALSVVVVASLVRARRTTSESGGAPS
ncbi:hypothetical protein [Nocardioides sp.]|uniref:hypothetical protein n=1 Tax=Nocardioides sp. TaxID=35761 RepID=UPI002B264FF3|nr:hypothetical protein [Nocardioides sp.]